MDTDEKKARGQRGNPMISKKKKSGLSTGGDSGTQLVRYWGKKLAPAGRTWGGFLELPGDAGGSGRYPPGRDPD